MLTHGGSVLAPCDTRFATAFEIDEHARPLSSSGSVQKELGEPGAPRVSINSRAYHLLAHEFPRTLRWNVRGLLHSCSGTACPRMHDIADCHSANSTSTRVSTRHAWGRALPCVNLRE